MYIHARLCILIYVHTFNYTYVCIGQDPRAQGEAVPHIGQGQTLPQVTRGHR